MKRIVILISGRGSNMEAVVRACDAQAGPARVVAVISYRPQASGLDFARSLGLQAEVVDHRAFADRAAFDEALAAAVERYQPDLVVLAGFMRILGAGFVQHYAGRLLNIHPSLLPAFPGLHTHQRALQAGCKIAGATVHFVTAELDHGPVVVQAAVPVLPSDDEASLAARVLQAEHQIYPKAVGWFVQGLLEMRQGLVRHTAGEPQHLWFV